MNCLTIFGRFNSMIDHILTDDLLPLLKTGYLSLSLTFTLIQK